MLPKKYSHPIQEILPHDVEVWSMTLAVNEALRLDLQHILQIVSNL